MPIPRVFVSYSSEDKNFVEQEILVQLERLGVLAWYAPNEIKTGEKFEQAIRRGLDSSDWFLVVVTKDSIESLYVAAEVQWAVTNRWSKMAIVLKDDSDPSQLHIAFGPLQYIDYGKDSVLGRQRLEMWIRSIVTDSQPHFVVSVVGARGGVGKSTITSRMAELVAESGSNCLIVDLDTGTAGSTSLQRERGYRGKSSTTYGILEALAKDFNASPGPMTLLDVTPDYLNQREKRGKVFFLPAVPLGNVSRHPTIYLIQKIIEKVKEVALPSDNSSEDETATKVMNVILSAAESAPSPIQCVFIDCGAEGPEFNSLVDAAHRLSNITYIVVQPDPSSRGNLTRVGTLLTRGSSIQTAHKLRVIINRVASADQEEFVRGQFADYVISGIIPFDPVLFDDVQHGRLNHFYRYDRITKAIHTIIERDFPITLVPKESDLWARSVVEKLSQRSPLDYLNDYLRQQSLLKLILGCIIGLVGAVYFGLGVLRELNDSSPADGASNTQILNVAVLALSCILLLYAIWRLRHIWQRARLLTSLQNLLSSSDPQQEMERFLIEFSRSDANLPLMDWLRTIVASPAKRQPTVTTLNLLRQILKRYFD